MNNTNLPEVIKNGNLPVIRNNQELHALVHQVFTPDKFNVLVPMAMNISPNVRVAILVVQLDDNPDLKKNKHFWSIDNEEAIFSAKAIRKLAANSGVIFTPNLTKITEEKYDKEGKPVLIRAVAHCTVINSLGNRHEGDGEYTYNYANDLEDTRFRIKEKRDNKWVPTDKVNWGQVNQRRQFADRLALTGAKKIAYFNCLGIDNSISVKDIGKPFVIPCVVENIDYDDPYVKKLVADRAIGATSEVYGKGAINTYYEVVPDEAEKPVTEQTQPAQAETTEPPPIVEAAPDESAMKRAAYKKDIEQMTSGDRAANIIELASLTKTAIPKIDQTTKKPIVPPDKWENSTQVSWLMHLAEKAGNIPPARG